MYRSTNLGHDHIQYKTMQWHDHRRPHASQWPKPAYHKRCITVPGGPRRRDTDHPKTKLQNDPQCNNYMYKNVIHKLLPNCGAQNTATCWQVNPKGHTSQQRWRLVGVLKSPSLWFQATLLAHGHVTHSHAGWWQHHMGL